MQKCCITHYLALHGKNVILQLHYNYTTITPSLLLTYKNVHGETPDNFCACSTKVSRAESIS